MKITEHKQDGKFSPRMVSEIILRRIKIRNNKEDMFWIYSDDKGIWIEYGEKDVEQVLRDEVLHVTEIKQYFVKEVIVDLKSRAYNPESPQSPLPNYIPFNNCIVDILTGEIHDYSSEWFFTSKLAVNYNSEHRECTTVNKIFSEWVAPNDVISLWELATYCMYRAYPYQKYFTLHGQGKNGKSRYQALLGRLLGVTNISNVTFEEIQYRNFAVGELYEKYANIAGEIDSFVVKRTAMMKKLTGDDYVRCDRKFRKAFDFINHAKIIFSTNTVPATTDKTIGFYRRQCIISFPNQFDAGSTANPDVISDIPQEEIEGFAYQCVEHLKRLSKQKFVFTNNPSDEETEKEYELLSNPIPSFITENCEDDADGMIPKTEFKTRFNSIKSGRKWSSQDLNRVMKDEGYYYDTKKYNGTLTRVWTGIQWKETV